MALDGVCECGRALYPGERTGSHFASSSADALREVRGQVNWRGIFADGETLAVLLILVGAATLVGAYSMTKPVLARLGLALIGALAPAIALTDNVGESLGWCVEMPYRAVWWTLQALAGRGDGQFYGDGPFMMAVIGWWTVFCLVLALRESLPLFRAPKAAEPAAAPNGGPPVTSGLPEGVAGPPFGELIRVAAPATERTRP